MSSKTTKTDKMNAIDENLKGQMVKTINQGLKGVGSIESHNFQCHIFNMVIHVNNWKAHHIEIGNAQHGIALKLVATLPDLIPNKETMIKPDEIFWRICEDNPEAINAIIEIIKKFVDMVNNRAKDKGIHL